MTAKYISPQVMQLWAKGLQAEIDAAIATKVSELVSASADGAGIRVVIEPMEIKMGWCDDVAIDSITIVGIK